MFVCAIRSPSSRVAAAPPSQSSQSRVRVVAALDEAIYALTVPVPDVPAVLRRLADQLKRSAEPQLVADIETFLNRMPDARSDFKCGAEFVRLRAQAALIRLHDVALGDAPGAVEGQPCYAAPFAVDATHPPDAVEIYGYDFDTVPVEMFLVEAAGYKDVSAAVIRRSHYHLTVRLGATGAAIDSASRSLGLTWGHLIRYSVPVIQPTSRLCRPLVQQLKPHEPIELDLDRAEGSNGSLRIGSRVIANLGLTYESNAVSAGVCAGAADPNGEATVSRCVDQQLFTVDADRTIDGILGSTESRVDFSVARGARQMAPGARGTPVRRWTASRLMSEPSDPRPQIAVDVRPIQVVSIDNRGCVSAVAYQEAKRVGAVSQATAQRLDADLTKLPRKVRGLRPRFAPPLPWR
jgi:hypothetical protein